MAPARAVAWIKPHGEGHDDEAKPCRAWRGVLLLGYLCLLVLSLTRSRRVGVSHSCHGSRMPPARMPPRPSRRSCSACPAAIAGWFVSQPVNRGLGWFFGLFNKAFDVFAHGYTRLVGVALRLSVIVLIAVRRPARAHRLGFHHLADRLHPRAGSGLCAGQRRPARLRPRCSGRRRCIDELVGDRASKRRASSRTMAVAGYSAVLPVRLVQLGHDLRHPGRLRRSGTTPRDAGRRHHPAAQHGILR